MFRVTKSLFSKLASADAVVVGGGPCGVAVVGSILEQRPQFHQVWADPTFQAGRVGERYREVPSNTKVDLFIQFATALAPFREIVDNSKEPNAITVLKSLPQDEGCKLEFAANMCLMLTDGLVRRFDGIKQHHGRVIAATFDENTRLWTATLDSNEQIQTPRLFLCTGSSPIANPLPVLQTLPSSTKGSNPKLLHLDVALKPSELAKTVKSDATVAVVGASHSAILVLMNLYNLATTTHPGLRIKWFTRHKQLRYAQYMDGWILYDNTGLKGQAAQWARENLEDEAFSTSPVSEVIKRLWTPVDEEENIYLAELPGCTHFIQAIGYKSDPLPQLSLVKSAGAAPEPLLAQHDDTTGRFFVQTAGQTSFQKQQYVPGLFGAGIAFPERVTDPAGNTEHAVGMWKFMKFLKRAVPEWLDSSERR